MGAGASMALGRVARAAVRQDGRIRGMTVSTPTWGWEWGTAAMGASMDALAALGVNWVAIHPYADIAANGAVNFRAIDPASPPDWLRVPIAEAHARGLKILIVPHLAYWGSPFSWRGDIQFKDEASWKRFFADYGRFVATLSMATRKADAFCVGSELDATVAHEADWRQVVRQVRLGFGGPLCYAANWSELGQVGFWDAVDAIGIQAYFPLVAGAQAPERPLLEASWSAVLTQMRALSDRWDRPVVFTELGYPRSADAAKEPWKAEDDPAASALQELCLDVALRALDREPRVVGAFLWKWFPGPITPRDFAMNRPAVQDTIRACWGA